MSKLAALKGNWAKHGYKDQRKLDRWKPVGGAGEGTAKRQEKARKKTNRTVPFSTRVSQQFDDEFRRIAFEGKLKHAELMEHMLEL